MDREILFRGKRVDNNQWTEGFLSFIYTDGRNSNGFIYTDKAQIYSPVEVMSHDVYTSTVGQFTGLTDKNGVKIFEGDILTTDLFRPYVVVIFRDGCFMFNCNDGGKDYWDIMLPIMKKAQTQTLYHEVIGNIHDTPDLETEEESE